MEHDRERDHFSDEARSECVLCSLAHVTAERDRLQAVVEAARQWRTSYDRPLAELSPEKSIAEHLAAVDALVMALDLLDAAEASDG